MLCVLFVANNGTCLRTGLPPTEVVGEYEVSENTLSAELVPLSDVFRDDASEIRFSRRRGSADSTTLSRLLYTSPGTSLILCFLASSSSRLLCLSASSSRCND